ncbi:hypothetical protein H4R26_002636 [Coemansia thaxteri]|uniref:NADH-cytochrome b5 reductase n=1 Tax=Coemansia thaxteri TaxID=2663907 RepID=A0A9W8EJY9_9FUNG|nr:hypothetical protein H4R26_002636 [Coemansia thaxteri]
MFAAIRNTLPRQVSPTQEASVDPSSSGGVLGGPEQRKTYLTLTRAYSTAPAGAKNGNGILWASLATGAVLVGGYYYTRSREATEGGAASSSVPATKALDPANFVAFKLKETIPINHDTSRFRFALEPNQELGLDITSCFVVKAKVGNDEKPTIRPYTPVSPQHARGYFDLVIKKYPTGKMSSHVHSMVPGDVLEIKGPIPKYPYRNGALKEIGMIAGGSGITPMLQLIQHVLADPSDHTKLTLVFANRSEDDIILRSTLDDFAKKHPDQLKVHYVVDKAASANWQGDVGYVTKELVQKYMPSAGKDGILVSVCGPVPMMKSISGVKAPDYSQGEVGGIFKELGYTSEQVFKF